MASPQHPACPFKNIFLTGSSFSAWIAPLRLQTGFTCIRKRNFMTTISRTIVTTLSAGIFAALLVSPATAGCGDLTNLNGPFQFVQQRALPASVEPSSAEKASARGGASPSIVGMWKVQFVSAGNESRNPPIPDGALVDFGYSQ